MSQTGIAAVTTMLLCFAIVVLYWKEIAALVFFAVSAVFCAGVYYIVATLYP